MEDVKFMDNAKIMAKGQITIPKEIRDALGVKPGDRVYFIVSSGEVTMVNSAIYALRKLQKEMEGEAEKAGIYTEEDVMNLVRETRYGKV